MNKVPGNNENNSGPIALAEDGAQNTLVQIQVNGVIIEVTEKVKANELLIKAKDAGGISGKVEEYIVERVEVEGEIRREEIIIVKEQEEFLAVPQGKTEVASCSKFHYWESE